MDSFILSTCSKPRQRPISALDEHTHLRAGNVEMNKSYEVRQESNSEKGPNLVHFSWPCNTLVAGKRALNQTSMVCGDRKEW